MNTLQAVYSAIRSQVPGVVISGTYLNQNPRIIMREDTNTIVIIDGVRCDVSILNTLNPKDIERVEMATNVAASNYLLNNRN